MAGTHISLIELSFLIRFYPCCFMSSRQKCRFTSFFLVTRSDSRCHSSSNHNFFFSSFSIMSDIFDATLDAAQWIDTVLRNSGPKVHFPPYSPIIFNHRESRCRPFGPITFVVQMLRQNVSYSNES